MSQNLRLQLIVYIQFKFTITDCGDLYTVANGIVEYGTLDTTYGSLVPIVCNTGFKLSGGTGTECLASGKWSTAVTCEIIGTFCPFVLL